MVTTAPFTSNWPCLSPLVKVPNWVNDIFLKRRGADAFIGSRFAKSEPYAQCVVFLLPLWPHSSPVQQRTIPNVPSFAPTSQWHQELQLPHQLHIIHPADCPRFDKQGLLLFPMVHDLVQPLSSLRGSAATIPLLDFDLPFLLLYPHHPYHSPPEDLEYNESARAKCELGAAH